MRGGAGRGVYKMTTLQNRNVRIRGQRTSLRLEPAMWDALEEISRREGCSINEICTELEGIRGRSTRTAALRVFILHYFRTSATETGHRLAGHGRGDLTPAELRALISG